jgi:hypothetical protein
MLNTPGRATRRALAVISSAALLFAIVQFTVIADTTSAAVAETNETPLPDPSTLEISTQNRRLDVEGLATAGRFGTPEAIGDVNGDGVGDLAVGAFSDDSAGPDVGAVYILLMANNGTVATTQKITSGTAGFGGQLLEGGGFGFRIASIGDLDGDGIPDIVASAYRSDRAHVDAGEIWVLFLRSDGTVKDWQVITEGFGDFPANLREGDQFGVDVASVGDLDGDGSSDLAVGMWKRDGLGENDGGVLMLMLDPDGTVRDYQEISAVAGWADAPLDANSGFGASVEALGDLNSDGTTDLAVGSIGFNDERGIVWLLTLTTNGTVSSAVGIEPGIDATPALKPGARFGSGIANLGDVDGNGSMDLAVGAFGIKDFQGAVFVLQLDESLVTTASSRVTHDGLDAGDLFGHTIASLGDINGDGSTDLAVGAPGDDGIADNAGAVYIVSVTSELSAPPIPESPDDTPADEAEDGAPEDGAAPEDDPSKDEAVPNVPADEPEPVLPPSSALRAISTATGSPTARISTRTAMVCWMPLRALLIQMATASPTSSRSTMMAMA